MPLGVSRTGRRYRTVGFGWAGALFCLSFEMRPVVRDGAIVARLMMNLSASFDHRIVDGHDGASLVLAIKALLEYPATIFV